MEIDKIINMKEFLVLFKNGTMALHQADSIEDVYIYYASDFRGSEIIIDENVKDIFEYTPEIASIYDNGYIKCGGRV